MKFVTLQKYILQRIVRIYVEEAWTTRRSSRKQAKNNLLAHGASLSQEPILPSLQSNFWQPSRTDYKACF